MLEAVAIDDEVVAIAVVPFAILSADGANCLVNPAGFSLRRINVEKSAHLYDDGIVGQVAESQFLVFLPIFEVALRLLQSLLKNLSHGEAIDVVWHYKGNEECLTDWVILSIIILSGVLRSAIRLSDGLHGLTSGVSLIRLMRGAPCPPRAL